MVLLKVQTSQEIVWIKWKTKKKKRQRREREKVSRSTFPCFPREERFRWVSFQACSDSHRQIFRYGLDSFSEALFLETVSHAHLLKKQIILKHSWFLKIIILL